MPDRASVLKSGTHFVGTSECADLAEKLSPATFCKHLLFRELSEQQLI